MIQVDCRKVWRLELQQGAAGQLSWWRLLALRVSGAFQRLPALLGEWPHIAQTSGPVVTVPPVPQPQAHIASPLGDPPASREGP